ncbi:hypothetical protein [Oryzomonas rubra]|uniref:Uncharacterized protein n=1 Tax=Oryzomonas rubra TaxID=2509454 RepID=A0A5A9XDP3_9BACT|nr:hypothetical protein [Oryzomonas rubra]KAA0890359.1 hypothetical protein ET418_11875 [Oryzomonas rubra]
MRKSFWNESEFPKTTTLKIKKFAVKEALKKSTEGGDATASRDRLINLLAKVTGTGAAQIREESLLVTEPADIVKMTRQAVMEL